jgi:acyl-CoA thioesterase I
MKVKPAIALLCLLALSQGCGSHPGIKKLAESSVILAFGDSLTAGTGANTTESYPAVLAGLIGCRVVNAGVPGEESSDALLRLPAVLQKESPLLERIGEAAVNCGNTGNHFSTDIAGIWD